MEDWPDAYRLEFSGYEEKESMYRRVPVKDWVEPIDDYSFAGFLMWLEYMEIIFEVRRTNWGTVNPRQ